MEMKEVYPTIETYEAVIQAWIETGTWDGLLRAEDWAKRYVMIVYDSSKKPFF